MRMLPDYQKLISKKTDQKYNFEKKFYYGKCSKFLNTFLLLFSIKMLVIRAGIRKILARIANRTDPDQTASSGAA